MWQKTAGRTPWLAFSAGLLCAGCASDEVATTSFPAPVSAGSALGAVGLGALSWRMRKDEVRATYPFIGNAAVPHPTVPWDWNELTTNYRLGGCQFTLRFQGLDDDPRPGIHQFSALLGVTLDYRNGPMAKCRTAILGSTAKYLSSNPVKYQADESYYPAGSRNPVRYRDEHWSWTAFDSAIIVDRKTLHITVYDHRGDNPMIIR
jgi:hypothetical protein